MSDQTTDELPASGVLPSVQGKPAAKGSGYLPTIAGNVPIPSNLYDELEKVYQQKIAAYNPFQEWMKDIAAWGAPGEGLAKRQQEKSAREQELFRMRAEIASGRQAQQQLAQQRELFFGSPQEQQAVTPTAGAPAAGAPAAGAPAAGMPVTTTQVNQATGGLLGLVQDPALRRQIAVQYLENPKTAMTQLNAYLAKRAEDPAIKKEIDYLVNVQGMDPAQALPIAIAKIAGSGSFVPHDVRGVGGTTQQTPLQAATGLAQPRTTPAATGVSAAPVVPAAPGVSTAPVVPAAPGVSAAPAATTPATAVKPAAPAAPTLSARQQSYVNSPTGFAPGSKEDLEIRQQRQKEILSGLGKEKQVMGEEFAKQQSEMLESGKSAIPRLTQADRIDSMITKNPNAVGVLATPGIMSGILSAVQDGINAGQFGSVGISGVEKLIRNAGGSQTDIDAAINIARDLANMQLSAARSYLKGQGAVSDAERRLIAEATASTSQSPAAIRKFLQFNREVAKFDKEIHEAYKVWRKANRDASFEDFTLTSQAETIRSNYENRLVKIAEMERPGAASAQHPAVNLLDKYPAKKK